MAQYILLAEKIINTLDEKKQLKDNVYDNLRPIVLELQREIHNSQLIINRELARKLISNSIITFQQGLIDFSLTPQVSNKDEFTLWLAGFIQKITIDTTKEEPIPLMISPKIREVSKVRKEAEDKQIEYMEQFKLNDDFCDAINDYFKQIKRID